jgi:hypothetical protein
MITVGSISREEAAAKYHFLQENVRGRRKAINELTQATSTGLSMT